MATAACDLQIEVDSTSPNGIYLHNPLNTKAVCSLKIPNQMLLEWHKCNYMTLTNEQLIDKLNHKIKGQVVTIKPSSNSVASKLRQAMYRVKCNFRKCTGSRKQKELLEKIYHLFILEQENESCMSLMQEVNEAKESVELWKKIAEDKSNEIDQLMEDMATDYRTLYDEIEEKDDIIRNLQGDMNNNGKKIDEVGERQARRKLNEVKVRTKMALHFATTFGLMPHKVLMTRENGATVGVYSVLIMYVIH